MVVSRRDFMKRGTLVVLATGATLSIPDLAFGQQTGTGRPGQVKTQTVPSQSRPDPLNHLTKAAYEANLNTVFRIPLGASKAVGLTLIEVTNMGPVPDKTVAGQECFALKFSGPRGRPLSQGTYRMEHAALGRFDLFIVPGGKDKKGLYYQAVINRLNS